MFASLDFLPNGNVRFDLNGYFSTATKTRKHQNDYSNDLSLQGLLNGEEAVSAGVLNNAYGDYAQV